MSDPSDPSDPSGPDGGPDGGYAVTPPVLGRPSAAGSTVGRLRSRGGGPNSSYQADGGDGALVAVRGATVTGAGHRHRATGGEDAFGWTYHATGGTEVVVMVIADGVGSSPRAGECSAMAVELVCETAEALLDPLADLAAVSMVELSATVGRLVEATNTGLSVPGDPGLESAGIAHWATTLVVALLRASSPGGGAEVSAARVGDSSAFCLSDMWQELFDRPAGEDDSLADLVTAALPARVPAVETCELRLSPGEALVLVTDGVANPLRDGPTTVAPCLAATFYSPPNLLSVVGAVDFSRQGCHDDRTLLGIWPLVAAEDPR